MSRELSVLLALAQRDVTKLLRDRARLLSELVLPIMATAFAAFMIVGTALFVRAERNR